jgi:predicted dehydrogenase
MMNLIDEGVFNMSRKVVKRTNNKITRREFIGSSAAAAAAIAIVPATVLGSQGKPSPSERINVAFIGTGDMGMGNLNNLIRLPDVKVTAVCDVARMVDYSHKEFGGIAGLDFARETVDRYYANQTKSGASQGCKGYEDFREMLDKETGIDAVVVATPDHVHAAACLAAIHKGKHIYCEKPLAHSVYETRLVTEAARKAGVATQMGNQGHSGEGIRLAVEWVQDGAIGPVREVHGWTIVGREDWVKTKGRPQERPPVPEGMNWNLWVGPAPYRPYHPAYAPYNWRGWWDFGTGAIGDMACHNLDPAVWALDLGAPTSVEASCSGLDDENVPFGALYHYEFPKRGDMPPVVVKWYDGGLMPPRPVELEEERNLRDEGIYFVGDKGVLLMGGWAESPRIIPETKMLAYTRPPERIPRVQGHHRDWIDACKGGNPASSNFDYAGPLTEMVLLGQVALRTGKKIYWDAANLKATNTSDADKYIKPAFRDGWNL